MKIISPKLAVTGSLFLYGLFLLFHLAVIVGILVFDFVPIDFLWGGRMQTKDQLLVFEMVSSFITGLSIFIVSIKAGILEIPKLITPATIGMWVLFLMFVLNTLGNLFAETIFEKSLSIATAALAIFSLRLALEKGKISLHPNT